MSVCVCWSLYAVFTLLCVRICMCVLRSDDISLYGVVEREMKGFRAECMGEGEGGREG